MIKAVVFDMDGVLSDTEPYHKFVRDELLKELGVFSEELSLSALGKGLEAYWHSVIKKFNLNADAKKLTDDTFLRLADLAFSVPFKPMDGLTELLKGLKKRGYKIGVASSSLKVMVYAVLKAIGVETFVDAVVCGDEVKDVKPAPYVYAEALKRLKVLPDEAVAVEDSHTGAKGAINAGIKTVIAYAPGGALSGNENMDICAFKVSDLREILNVVQKL